MTKLIKNNPTWQKASKYKNSFQTYIDLSKIDYDGWTELLKHEK